MDKKERETIRQRRDEAIAFVAAEMTGMVKSEQAHPLGDGKNPFTGGQK